MADTVCPPLGTGSVDFDALHAAAAKGADLDQAVAAATTLVEEAPADPAPAPAPPAPASKWSPPATTATDDASA